MRRELFHAVLMSIECAEIWLITCNTGSTADEVLDFHSASCSSGEMINFTYILFFRLGFFFPTHPCLAALPSSHHVHVEEPTRHGCNSLQVGAQRPAILLVNRYTGGICRTQGLIQRALPHPAVCRKSRRWSWTPRGWWAWRPSEIRMGPQSRVHSQVGLTGIFTSLWRWI